MRRTCDKFTLEGASGVHALLCGRPDSFPILSHVSIEHLVGLTRLRRCYADPYISRNRGIPESVVVRVKARAVKHKRLQRLDPAGGRWGLFGLHTVPDSAKEVVLTEVQRLYECFAAVGL